PFRFKVMQVKGGDPILYLLNGAEQILVDEFEQVGDSVKIGMHIFNSEIITKIGDKTMNGRWIRKDYDDYQIPFQANLVDTFKVTANPEGNVAGKWAVNFKATEEGEEDEMAVGIFDQQEDGTVTGTFLTTTGDYRYLFGKMDGRQLLLSCFDGAHSFLFKADMNAAGDLENGEFLNGKHWYQEWEAKRDENAKLPDLNTLTYLKEGYDKLAFSFPNLEGEQVSLNDDKYQGKVVIVQLFGSWCPNCMDETKFLAPFYDANKARGVEIIGLAFERKPEFEKAKASVMKMKNRLGVNYELLIAGINDKEEAAKQLPMLNHVLAYPTTIFIDKKGIVRKIHTGFTGPGTGAFYVQFVDEFNQFIDKLVAENPS
ncbi:MAG: peroxiredoxin family protein, partial [Flammeovirgaceae bacterium]